MIMSARYAKRQASVLRVKRLYLRAPKAILHADKHSAFLEQELINPRACYICKNEFTKVHFFYDTMCPSCAEFNYAKRFQTASLEGPSALITGARLKIGYQASLMMLRAGAHVIATTRFPVDAALRYSREADFKEWGRGWIFMDWTCGIRRALSFFAIISNKNMPVWIC